ncbi:antibiotic biosynthesis monooxygenase [Herbiconiux sp. KACC 21604]|uniref:antibiotic biosynthesis monooxygenase family protein n=1 Tax=unclassified Herbiconiux TaxID=2618217 RepID=UPI001492BB9F|nr:antibiotic biosynthesis monooxygenase [Herbiconiux sp. SALV-R1]QJU55628.1 antibiotic biosynthesis monooxygenase [Herbiconiux sp. SALV-R1]WPO86825.1 antibiotic biosynthesis monooxygenase [Herbiconiux sp. KACC 21604]
MVHEYALLTVAVDDVDAFEASHPAASSILLSSPGCRSVEFQRSIDEPGIYLMKVGWDRVEDHLDTFASSAAAIELSEVIGRYFSSPPTVAHFER